MGIFHVVGDEASEPLLTGSVPQLDAVVFGVAGDVFDVEIDADCGLGKRNEYIEAFFELVFDVFFDDGGFAYRLVSEEDDFVLGPASAHRAGRNTHWE